MTFRSAFLSALYVPRDARAWRLRFVAGDDHWLLVAVRGHLGDTLYLLGDRRCDHAVSRRAILAVVDRGHLTVGERLIRIRGLLKGVPGPLGNGEMLAWVNTGDVDSMPQDVLELIVGAVGRLERWTPGGSPDDIPNDAADLMTKLTEVDEAKGTDTLVWLLSSTMAYRVNGRYTKTEARDVVDSLSRLLGYGARWWINSDLGDYPAVWPYRPVTQNTMSAVVVAVGNGILVTVLAVDED